MCRDWDGKGRWSHLRKEHRVLGRGLLHSVARDEPGGYMCVLLPLHTSFRMRVLWHGSLRLPSAH